MTTFQHGAVTSLANDAEALILVHHSLGSYNTQTCGVSINLTKMTIRSVSRLHCLKQEQQRVAVGPGNAQFMSIRQVSLVATSVAATALLLLQGNLLINN